jgi:hypothetical protein
METYTQNKQATVIDWRAALTNEPINWDTLGSASSMWVTCACGNQCVIIPRDESGRPLDTDLVYLGNAFHEFITNQNAEMALLTLTDIEERSEWLIQQILSTELKLIILCLKKEII